MFIVGTNVEPHFPTRGVIVKKSILVLLAFILTVCSVKVSAAQNRYALVIGNSNYEDAPLRNPVHDADAMAATLARLGFSVDKKTDVAHQEMEEAIRAFANRIGPGDVALFYYSGHGSQVKGLNYLIPIGARIASADEIKY